MKLARWFTRTRSEGDDVAFETALFTLTTQVPRPTERRADPRVLPFLPVAKLIVEGYEQLCRVRNLSAGGLMAEVVSLPPAGAEVAIEFDSARQVAGEVAWVRGSNIGVKFDSSVDLRAIFSGERPHIGYRPRPPRLDMQCQATVRVDGVYHKVAVQDVSTGGMKVALRLGKSKLGRKAVVAVESLDPVRGTIRWSKGGMTGIAFERPIAFEELARWMGKRVDVASVMATTKVRR
ncbi:MAG TPA: PilZ domain-containing protein [Allosphingosinicella sp.]